MKKVIIRNKQGIETHGTEMENPAQWIAHCVENNFWGKPERWIKENSEEYSQDDVLDNRLFEVSPGFAEQLDDSGNVLQQAILAITETQVKLKAEYTIEIIDITQEIEQQRINLESLKYLQDTDWYIIREVDSGIPCPAEIKAARAAARAAIVK